MSARSLPTARSARFGHLRVLSSAVAVGTFAAVVLVASAGSALAATPANVQRVAGADRLATAIATSQDQFPTAGSASAVVLARSDTFPDALAGGPLDGALVRVASTEAIPRSRAAALDYAARARSFLGAHPHREELEALTYAVVDRAG